MRPSLSWTIPYPHAAVPGSMPRTLTRGWYAASRTTAVATGRRGAPATVGPVTEIVDLLAGDGRGPLYGAATEDLNVTLLAWRPGDHVAEHVNGERDVLLVVLAGGGTLTIDGADAELRTGVATVIPKGARRGIVAGPAGVRYLTSHLRRGGLTISRPDDN
jgi:quercetin dioxygenase-like cupin family protein